MATGSLPLMFGEILVGGYLLSKGVKAIQTGFGGSSTAALSTETPAAAPASTSGATMSPGSKQGDISFHDLHTANKYGWSGGDLVAWWHLISGESGGRSTARNASSGAFGIGQFLGGTLTTYTPYGAASTNPLSQLNAMARYIHDRYGTPTNALAQWESRSPHWY